MTTERPLRFGLAGLGPGAMSLLGGFLHSPHVELKAVADVRQEAVDAFSKDYDVEKYLSVEQMCESPNIDAVYVVTPTQYHAGHVIAAAERGKHVIVTKPMAITIEDCEAMNEAADRNGVQIVCGHTQSMLAPVRRLAEAVWSGEFGRLGMLHTWHYTDWIYRPRRPYELDMTLGGGVVYRQSPHQIDIVRLIAGGDVKSVRATVLQLDPDRPAPGAYSVFLQFANGTPATIIYSGYGHFNANELTFGGDGTEAARRAAPAGSRTAEEEQALKDASGYVPGRAAAAADAPFTAFGLTLVTCERADLRQSPNGLWVYEPAGKREIVLPREEARGEAEFEEMYQAVKTGRPSYHDGHWGLATHEVTLGILESSRTGQEQFMSRQTALPV